MFSPLALFWFYLSYQSQSKELELQRESLDKQVTAQKGSEESLRILSGAVEKQLTMIEKQFRNYEKAVIGKQPNFELVEYFVTTLFYSDLEVSPDEQRISRAVKKSCKIQ